jgi:hypothetical protein
MENMMNDTTAPSDSIDITFVGDVSFGENYKGTPELLVRKGYHYPFESIAPLLHGSDLVIANLETPITDLPTSPLGKVKKYTHWSSVVYAPVHLKSHNMLTFSLANNHSMDFGEQGLIQTLRVLRENGMQWFGAGMTAPEAALPFIETFTGHDFSLKIAVFGAFEFRESYEEKYSFYARNEAPGVNPLISEHIRDQIADLKSVDPSIFVVVYPHWGDNYSWRNEAQIVAAHELIDSGADIIIGHGAHAFQELEFYRGKWIFHSLGNFVFLSPGRYTKMQWHPYSMVARLTVSITDSHRSIRMQLYPIYSDNKVTDYQVRLLRQSEFNEFRALLLNRSVLGNTGERVVKTGRDEIGYYLEVQG